VLTTTPQHKAEVELPWHARKAGIRT